MRRKIEGKIDKAGFGMLTVGKREIHYIDIGQAYRLQREIKKIIRGLQDPKMYKPKSPSNSFQA